MYTLRNPSPTYTGADREGLLSEPRPPSELKESFRRVVERIQAEDTKRVRAWVDSLARAGVVTTTSGDVKEILVMMGSPRPDVPGSLPYVEAQLKPYRFLYDPWLSAERSGWI